MASMAACKIFKMLADSEIVGVRRHRFLPKSYTLPVGNAFNYMWPNGYQGNYGTLQKYYRTLLY